MKKLVRGNMADVGNEVDAVRHSFINKAPMSFMFSEPLIINDINGSENMKLIGGLLVELWLAPSAYIENVTFSI